MTFDWTEECEVAFREVKQRLMSAPVLRPPDLTKPFQLWTDASERGFGVVLEQKGQEDGRHPKLHMQAEPRMRQNANMFQQS